MAASGDRGEEDRGASQGGKDRATQDGAAQGGEDRGDRRAGGLSCTNGNDLTRAVSAAHMNSIDLFYLLPRD